MKRIFLLIVGVASFTAMQAQTKYGLKAGVNLANFSGDVEDNKMKIGLNVGAFAKFSLTEAISLQPEVVFSAQGAKYDGEEGEGKLNLNYLNIPVLFQYNTTSGFYGETGPQIGFLMSAKDKPEEGDDVDVKDGFKSTDFSWAIGAGFLTKSGFGVNARFNLGLGNILEESGDYKMKNSVIQIGVFYALGGKK